MSNSQVISGPSRHPKYYFDDVGCSTLLVQNTLYRLPVGTLCRHSVVFANMFLSCGSVQNEGQDDYCPIIIDELLSSTFDFFVEHHFGFPRTGSNYDKEELLAFLSFCDKYICEGTKEFVVDRIEVNSWRFHPAELMGLAIRYQLPSLFRIAFKSLTKLPLTQITKAHRELISSPVFISLALAKAVLDEHCRIVAAEEPRILSHADDCQDPPSCEVDWHGIWWNGMGRYLLDGRNPQPYEEAVRRFKRLQFGRMGKGCKDMMFRLLDEGRAFHHADYFVDDLCDHLIETLHL